jgi:lysozyme
MSTAVVITDIPADQKDAVVKLYKDAGATVQVLDQGGGLYTITATYPDAAAGAPPNPSPAPGAAPAPVAPAPKPAPGATPAPADRASNPAPGIAPSQPTALSPVGAALIKSFENCLKPNGHGNFVPYVDPVGVLTIGWGHTNDNGRQFGQDAVWTQEDCDDAFDADMRIFCAVVSNSVKVPLNQNQFDALVSFAYNVGSGGLKGSTLLKKLNQGDYAGAAGEFPRWNKGGGKVLPGLVRRRAAEMHLFLSSPSVSFALDPQGMASIVRVS